MKARALIAAIAIALASFIAAPAHASNIAIGIAYDIGGRGDRSFNDAAAAGLEKAQKQFSFSVQPVVTDGTTADRERRVRALIASKCNPVILVGSGYAPTVKLLAIEFPNTQFAILNDASVDALNVTSLIFSDTQGAYLAGYSAAIASKTGKVSMIANTDQADIYQNGFKAGVDAAKKKVTSTIHYVNGSSIAASKSAMDSGADVLFVARPGSDTELFASVVSRNIAKSKVKNYRQVGLIMVEPDQYLTLSKINKKYLYASVVKHVDQAMYDVIAKTISGEQILDVLDAKAGIYGHRYTVLGGGVSFTTYLPALTSAATEINKAAANASKIAG